MHHSGRVCMAAVAAGYRNGLVGAGWPTLLLSCMQKTVLSPRKDSISGFVGSFQSGGVFCGRRALTIKCLVMSRCGQGDKPAKEVLKEAVDHVSRANSCQKLKHG